MLYVTQMSKAITARNPWIIRTARVEVGKMQNGPTADQFAQWITSELDRLQPNNILFVGNTLYKQEIVQYLHERKQNGATVVLLFGRGSPMLSKDAASLDAFSFSCIMEAPIPLNTQALLAFNTLEKGPVKSMAFVGTYPFDRSVAENSENMLVEVLDTTQCQKLLNGYQTVLQVSKQIR